MNLVLTPGNWGDRAPVLALLDGVDGGITLGDLGYRGQQRAEEWVEEADMFVLTRADAPEKKKGVNPSNETKRMGTPAV